MPYHVGKAGSCPASKPYAVLNSDTGRVMGCHATQAQAAAQLKALYANEPGASVPRRGSQRS